jgi:lysozyme family protein
VSDFQTALGFTLSVEGGYTKADGHPTNYGVRQDTYDKWREAHGARPVPVSQITSIEASNLYRDWYWEPTSCDAIPYPVAVCVFDTAVNSGQATAIRLLQRSVWADEDGIVGKDTMDLVGKVDPYMAAHSYITLRRLYYKGLVGRIADQSIRGWLARCGKLWQHVLDVKNQ